MTVETASTRHPQRARAARSREGALRIGVVAPVWLPVPPAGYGGTERVVHGLVEGLVAAGHDVTLFASGDSCTHATLRSVYQRAPFERMDEGLPELRHALACVEHADEFDIIHDHSGVLAAALLASTTTPVVHTVHVALEGERSAAYRALARTAPAAGLVSLSLSQRRGNWALPWVANCPNGLDLSAYPPGRRGGEYLLFLGRMSPDKGCHRAIEVARAAGLPLAIAAKCRLPDEREYYRRFVAPQLDDRVRYLGEVGQSDKVRLLQGARALLMPIEWEEPFGLVMIESMACGTPVIAMRRGAVPEVIVDGVSGIIVDDYRDMHRALALTDQLGPREIRRTVVDRFSTGTMVASYLRVYRTAVATSRGLAPAGATG